MNFNVMVSDNLHVVTWDDTFVSKLTHDFFLLFDFCCLPVKVRWLVFLKSVPKWDQRKQWQTKFSNTFKFWIKVYHLRRWPINYLKPWKWILHQTTAIILLLTTYSFDLTNLAKTFEILLKKDLTLLAFIAV